MYLKNKKPFRKDSIDKIIDYLLKERKPPYEEIKDNPEALSFLPLVRLLKTLRPSPPENMKVRSLRPWLIPALSILSSLLLALILVALFLPGAIPLFARYDYFPVYLGPSVYTVRLEVKLDGKITESESAKVWYISQDTFRIQVKNLLQGQVDELIANGNDAWCYFPDENRWVQVGLLNLPPEWARFLLIRPFFQESGNAASQGQSSSTGVTQAGEEIEAQSGWSKQRIYKQANLEATLTLEEFEKVKSEQIEPFREPSGRISPATLDSLVAHLEKDQFREGEDLNLAGFSSGDRYLLVKVWSAEGLSLEEKVYRIKEGEFSISLSFPELTPGQYSLTYYDLVPFAGMREGRTLPFQVLP
ncbi:MAG: hypothetical protein ACPL7L_01065 [bacterium]